MRSEPILRFTLAAAVLFAASAHAECVSTVVPVSVRGVIPNRSAEATAWSGSSIGVLKVDERSLNATYFGLYDAGIRQTVPDVQISSATFSGPLSLIWTGREFGAFYLDREARLMLQRISEAGVPLGTAIPLLTRFDASTSREYDIAWDSARQAYLIGHTVDRGQNTGLWFSSVSEAGVERFSQLITFLVDQDAKPQLAVNANGTAMLVFQRGSVNYAILTSAGEAQLKGGLSTARDARIGTDGADFVVVATSSTASSTLRWLKVNPAGTIILSERTLFTSNSIDAIPVELLWNPALSEWALSYLDSAFGFPVLPGELRLRRFSAAGGLVSDSSFALQFPASAFESLQPFFWNGSAYVGAVSRLISAAQGTESYLTTNCPVIPAINSDHRFAEVADVVTFSGSASGGAPGYTYTWDFGDGSLEESGQTVKHFYLRNGTFAVTLRVTDTTGGRGTATTTVSVVTGKRRAVKR